MKGGPVRFPLSLSPFPFLSSTPYPVPYGLTNSPHIVYRACIFSACYFMNVCYSFSLTRYTYEASGTPFIAHNVLCYTQIHRCGAASPPPFFFRSPFFLSHVSLWQVFKHHEVWLDSTLCIEKRWWTQYNIPLPRGLFMLMCQFCFGFSSFRSRLLLSMISNDMPLSHIGKLRGALKSTFNLPLIYVPEPGFVGAK